MGVFGNGYIKNNSMITEDIQFSSEEQLIFVEMFSNTLLEDYIDGEILDAIDESTEEVIEEGTNLDAYAAMRRSKKLFKTYKKQYKRSMTKGDYKTALEVANKMKNEIKGIKKEIDSLDWDNISTSVAGTLGYFFINLAQAFIACILSRMVVGAIGGVIANRAMAKAMSSSAGDNPFELFIRSLEATNKGADIFAKTISIAKGVGLAVGSVKIIISAIKDIKSCLNKDSSFNKSKDQSVNGRSNSLKLAIYRIMDGFEKACDDLIENAKKAEKISKGIK